MIKDMRVTVVLPAFNAELTLEQTYQEIPFDIVDHVILVDDLSSDRTLKIAENLDIQHIVRHEANLGYGANQKSCYNKALELDSDIIVMLHPDYQYTPRLIHAMCHVIASGVYDVVLGSRILGRGALKGGMPLYKYVANRILTLFQNVLMGQKLSEYHTGYRVFSKKVLTSIRYQANSDGFVFDNQMIAQIFYAGFEIAEITCPTRYSEESSSIKLKASMVYGLGVLLTSFQYRLQKMRLARFSIFEQ